MLRIKQFRSQPHDFSKLKAILVIGIATDGFEIEMNEVAVFFHSQGVKVEKFYTKNSDWNKIKEAARGAHFFIYMGHGSTMGGKGKAGGLVLTTMVSSETIINELQLSKDAIVLFQSVCYSAGSTASDSKEISVNTAFTRVSDYAKPFIKIGASCYYADNYYGSMLRFLKPFFKGTSVKAIFVESTRISSNIKIELEKPYKHNSKMKISISSSPSGTFIRRYDIAYVAKPNFTIMGLL